MRRPQKGGSEGGRGKLWYVRKDCTFASLTVAEAERVAPADAITTPYGRIVIFPTRRTARLFCQDLKLLVALADEYAEVWKY